MKQALDAARRNFWHSYLTPPPDTHFVLLSLADVHRPVWPGNYDRAQKAWKTVDGENVTGFVAGWMELREASKILMDV